MLGTCTLGPALEDPHTFAAEGALTTAAADDDESTVLVEARGLFIRLRPGQVEQLARSAPHPGPSRD
jgi:hypothetical protein